MPTIKSYLSVRQCVQRLNGAVSAKLIYKLIEQGKLRANKRLGKVLVEEESFVELLEGKPIPVVPSMASRVKPRAKRAAGLW